jgi:fructokinase
LYISGTGIELTYAEQSHGEKKRAFEIFQLATQSDSVAKKVVQQYCGDLARFLANLSNILDPDFFVLGGGVSQAEVIYKGLESSVGGDLFLPVSSPVVYKNQLGDSAGSLGAAFLVFTKILMN